MKLIGRAALVGACLVMAGCAQAEGHTTSAPTADSALVTTGTGWSASSINHVPAGPCHLRTTADGQPLPDPGCTPGAVDASASRAAVCAVGGWEKTHPRPPAKLTAKAKRQIMRAYGLDPARASDYELDHLVPKSLGGSDDARNLWPQIDRTTWARPNSFVANDKDALEILAKRGVCSGRGLDLDQLRHGFVTDWTALKPVLVVSTR